MPNVSNRPVTRNNSSSSQPDSLTMDDKLNLLLEEVRKIKLGNDECLNEITSVKDDIKQFKKDISDSLDMCFGKIKDCEDSINKNSNNIVSCEELIDALKSENISLNKSVNDLKKRVIASEQYSRSNCIEISGVPETKNENIISVVKQVANALNFKLDASMIDAAHRLSKNDKKPDLPRGIIVKFCRRFDMEEMRKRTRVKKSIAATELGYHSEGTIYINLSLGRETRQLWSDVRNFKADHDFKYAWITSAGKIFLRKTDKDNAIHITEKADLEQLK